jgi:copper transport protein
MPIIRNKQHFRQLSWALVLVGLIGLLMTQRASAHAYLVRSEPAANMVLDSAPATMRLWFSETVSLAFSGARLLSAGGQGTELSVSVDPVDDTLMVVTLPELADGVYSLRWTVHSEADGHVTQGLIVFGIGQGADLGTATAVETETAVPVPEALLRWLTFGLYAGLVGAFATTFLVLNPQSQPTAVKVVQQTAQIRMLHLAWWCGLLAFLVGLAWVGWQALALANSAAGGLSVADIGWQWLTQTRLGLYWWARQIVILLVLRNLSLIRHQPLETPGWPIRLTGILLLVLLLIQSLTSHAAALTPNTAIAIAADTLHLLAASFWIGGLLALVVSLLPLVQHHAEFKALVKAGWGPFGKWAALSVGVLFATGLYSMGREVDSANALLTTFYGQTLLLKIGVVLLVGMIGAINAVLLRPGLTTGLARLFRKPAGWTPVAFRRLPRLFVAEVSLGLLVLLLAGIITAAPTARTAAFSPEETTPDLSQTVDDMIIKFAVTPNQAGQNVFTVRAVSTRRPPPAEIVRVILRFTYLEEDLGLTSVDMINVEPDLYLLSGSQLYLAGTWQIDAVVRRQGVEDSVARFTWFVPTSEPETAPIVSDTPWEPPLTAVALILLVLVLGTAVIFPGFRR